MRKTLLILSAAAVVAVATSASARERIYVTRSAQDHYAAVERNKNAASVGTGAIAGTAAGVAITEGAVGGTLGAALPATAAGAAAVGGVAGIGAGALIHAATTPCQGFHALFGNFLTNAEGCVNGRFVGYEPRRTTRVIR
jgi:hypothetical protein